MKVWVFIGGVVVCSLLFFASGTLVGYHSYEKKIEEAKKEKKTPQRKPSAMSQIAQRAMPLIGTSASSKVSSLQGKIRMPSSPAINTARQYSGF